MVLVWFGVKEEVVVCVCCCLVVEVLCLAEVMDEWFVCVRYLCEVNGEVFFD